MALNGRLPLTDLAVIPWDGRDQVRIYALPSLARLNAAFRAVFGHNLVVNEGYRDYATQEKYYKNPPSGAGTAAKPGTSNHGWGLAVDLKLTSAEYAWMLANAPRCGWINPLWARDGRGVEEPWHWEHVGAPAVTPDPIRTTPLEEDDTMRVIKVQQSGTYYAVTPLTVQTLTTMDYVAAAQLLGGQVQTVNAADMTRLMDVVAANRRLLGLDGGGVDVDPQALAAALAPMVIPAIVQAVADDADTPDLTEAQVQAATERAIRAVLGSLG